MGTGHDRLGLSAESGGFTPAPVVFEQAGQIVEADGHIGMIGTEAFLVDGERAAIKRLSLGKPVCVLKQ